MVAACCTSPKAPTSAGGRRRRSGPCPPPSPTRRANCRRCSRPARGAASGLLIYNDSRFPENYRGLLLYPDVEGRSIHAYKVERKGATFEVAEEFELLRSDDPLFRPCQVVVGPDGALYVVDRRGEEQGRIYRLTWAGTKDQPALPPRGMDSWAKIAGLGDDDLIKTLQSEDAGDRDRARRELARRGEKERPALLKLLRDSEQPDAARIAALGALEVDVGRRRAGGGACS